ncbi:MAG: N-acetylmuramoyl-L-alanine amidase family protein, partial [Cetobacterium sp.]|uniref:N-acetylmuramoyl-L-alanine amidase family protein n=1 Tax=Cetobacterium sp. TaxID=2071632 RepID=UPI003F2FBD50
LINGSWHVYDKNGTMLTGWIEQWGSWYYFNTDGTMRKNAWLHQSNGQTFYLGSDGIKYVGKHTIGGVEYTFNSAGILINQVNGKKFDNVTLSNVLDFIFFGIESEVSAYNLVHYNSLEERIKKLTVDPFFEAGPFKISLECQLEDDVKIPSGNQLQFLNGNLSGVILKNQINIPTNIFEQNFGDNFKQKLNFEFGKPGNGTYFDIQTLLTLWNSGSKVGDCDAILDFEFAWQDSNGSKAPVIMITGELQRILETTEKSTKYLNALLKFEIDLSKLNIDPASYLFTHNISQYLLDINHQLMYTLANVDKSKFANTQNPDKIYEILKTLSLTFGQVSLSEILNELKGNTEADGWKEFKNIFETIYSGTSETSIVTGVALIANAYGPEILKVLAFSTGVLALA